MLSFPSIPSIQTDYKLNYFYPLQHEVRKMRSGYSQKPLNEIRSILWTVNILSDGWGDLFNCLNAYRLTNNEYPKWTMWVYASIHKGEIPFNIEEYGLKPEEVLVIPRNVEKAPNTIAEVFYAKTGNWSQSPQSYKDRNDQLCSELPDLAKKIDAFINFSKTADIEIAISSNPSHGFSKTLKDSLKFLHLQEYGGTDCSYDIPDSNTLIMGVAPNSCGIHILNPEVPEHFINPLLHHYFRNHDKVYFNFGWDIQGFVSLVCRLNPNAKEINIVMNSSYEVIEKLKIEGNITAIYLNNEDTETIAISSLNQEKTIRFINPFPLEHDDMIRAMKLSQEPVGITGNGSFSEALALDKLIFYNNRDCLQPFWNQLVQLAKHATPDYKKLISYLEQMSFQFSSQGIKPSYMVGKDYLHIDDVSGKNSDVVLVAQDLPVLQEQWADLVAILRQDWNVKDALLGEINRRIQLQRMFGAGNL